MSDFRRLLESINNDSVASSRDEDGTGRKIKRYVGMSALGAATGAAKGGLAGAAAWKTAGKPWKEGARYGAIRGGVAGAALSVPMQYAWEKFKGTPTFKKYVRHKAKEYLGDEYGQ